MNLLARLPSIAPKAFVAPTGWFTDHIHPWFRGIFSSAPSAALRAPRFLLVKADQGSRRAAEDAEKKQ